MSTKKERMNEQIKQHGVNLLALYPHAQPADADKLCRKLHRLEAQARAIAVTWCNGDEPMGTDEAAHEQAVDAILSQVRKVLGDGPTIRFNGDARGHAIKIDSENMPDGCALDRDWGGNGIVCPEFTGER